jgi:DNA-binding PadR family transcriptional regulator
VNEKVEKEARRLGEQMKKGYISHLILLVLKDNPSYGYKIIQEINRRTKGMWDPSTSTIYHVLDSLGDKNLITILREEEKGRQKKIYKITKEGEKALEILIETYKDMQEAMRRMIFSSIKLFDDIDIEKMKDFIPNKHPIFGVEDLKDDEEKIRSLEIKKILMQQRIKEMKMGLRNIDIEIERLKNRTKN